MNKMSDKTDRKLITEIKRQEKKDTLKLKSIDKDTFEIVGNYRKKLKSKEIEQIAVEYITNDVKLGELSHKYKIDTGYLRRISLKRRWKSKKEKYQEDRESMLLEEVKKHDIENSKDRILEIRQKYFEVWNAVFSTAKYKIGQIIKDIKAEADSNGQIKAKISNDAIQRITKILEISQINHLKCLGLSDQKLDMKLMNELTSDQKINVLPELEKFLKEVKDEDIFTAAKKISN